MLQGLLQLDRYLGFDLVSAACGLAGLYLLGSKNRYGFLLSSDRTAGSRWAMFDHQTRSAQFFGLGPDVGLAEMCFVPRKRGAPEGDGYLIGVASHYKENGRSDLVLVDTKHLDAGPIASVKMPYRVPGQIHGFWVAGEDLPEQKA